MPRKVVKTSSGRYKVTDPEGHNYGSHATKEEAEAQMRAIGISKAPEAGHRIPKPKGRKKS